MTKGIRYNDDIDAAIEEIEGAAIGKKSAKVRQQYICEVLIPLDGGRAQAYVDRLETTIAKSYTVAIRGVSEGKWLLLTMSYTAKGANGHDISRTVERKLGVKPLIRVIDIIKLGSY